MRSAATCLVFRLQLNVDPEFAFHPYGEFGVGLVSFPNRLLVRLVGARLEPKLGIWPDGIAQSQAVACNDVADCVADDQGGVGLPSKPANVARSRLRNGYRLSAVGAGALVKIGVAITPGSTIATRTLKGRNSCASNSLTASSAHFDAA